MRTIRIVFMDGTVEDIYCEDWSISDSGVLSVTVNRVTRETLHYPLVNIKKWQ